MVIQCLPILHPEEPSLEGNDQKEMMLISPPSLPLPELLRLVNHKGFFIVGFPAVLWDKYEIQSLVDHISSSNSGNIPGEWLVMQRITLPLKDVKVFQDGYDDVVVNDWQAFDSPVVMMSKRNGPPVRKNSTNVFSNSSSDSSVNSNKSNGSSSSQVVNNEKEVAIEYCLALFRKK